MATSAAQCRSFEHLLRDQLSLDDTAWAFDVPSLATAEVTNRAKLIILISLSTSGMRHKITLRYDPAEMNRAIREAPLDQFILVSFAEFKPIRAQEIHAVCVSAQIQRLQRRYRRGSHHGKDRVVAADAEVDEEPYTFGYLNDETIVLLDALRIDRQILVKKQREHFDFLLSASKDPRTAFRFLNFLNKPDLAERVLMEPIDAIRPAIEKLIHLEFEKMLNKREEQKCRILIPKSRLLFGVCDAWGVLKIGQCAVKVTMDHDGQPYALNGTKVLVTRNPCLHPGDMQKFNVVAHPQLAHLVDCIVFPVVGKRPAADLMSGGDLDGDTFFVTWDPEIIPNTVAQAAHYPGVREKIQFAPITEDDRILHFAKYTNASLGRVKNMYLRWARAKGAMSSECQELNRLFSQCVDGNRIKASQLTKFEKAPAPPADGPLFVLDELHELARGSVSSKRQHSPGQIDDYPFEDMEQLLCREDLVMSESELVKLGVRWCRKMNVPFHSILHVFNMNDLSAEEKSWVLAQIPATIHYPQLVMNALCSSDMVHQSELDYSHLGHQGMHWKRVYTSSEDRLATFMEAACRNLEIFCKTLILFRPNNRLTLAIYVPQKIPRSDDFLVEDRVRMFAFPHSQGTETQSRLSLPTKKGYRLYCDENALQLFDEKRANTWVFIARGPSDDASYRSLSRQQDRRQARMASIETGVNYDFRASIALDKFSRGLQRHVGRISREGILAAEIYVISNRDTRSMRQLDLWEQYVDTDEQLPLFEQDAEEYDVPLLKDIEWSFETALVVEVARRRNYASLKQISASSDLKHLFDWLIENCQTDIMSRCYKELMDSIQSESHVLTSHEILHVLVEFLPKAPCNAVAFASLGSWSKLSEEVAITLQSSASLLLRSVILAESEYGQLVVSPFQAILDNLSQLSLNCFSELVETISLTVHRIDVALDLLLGCLERNSYRLLAGRVPTVQFFVRNVIAIALDHLGEVEEGSKMLKQLFKMTRDETAKAALGQLRVNISLRIDSPDAAPKCNTHVRLIAASPPKSSILKRTCVVDGLVSESRGGELKIVCFHSLPSFYQECSWRLQDCGLFVTTQTTLEAVKKLATLGNACCGVADQVIGLGSSSHAFHQPASRIDLDLDRPLNESQDDAVRAAQNNKLLCLWGPPGTGKTQTIVAIIRTLQLTTESRLLVTAPTHNAVDNVMRRYLVQLGKEDRIDAMQAVPLRVSTEVRKVADDLRPYTCDALVGQEIYTNQTAMQRAKKRVKEARIIFTTCMGAGLGLLRGQTFNVVIVDEASQQTEPASLVPLVSGCSKAILVGDHVQLRPTVQNVTQAINFDVSLFERLYTRKGETPGMARIMLDRQYRMHSSICTFASREFYFGKLLSGVCDSDRRLPKSSFPWPHSFAGTPSENQHNARIVFLECAGREDLGHKSKSNMAQAELCVSACKLLLRSHGEKGQPGRGSLVVLTPYTRQRELLSKLLKDYEGVEVSSIDGFQGREADIVIFVSVRCNESADIGFLKDLRRLNVAITRARLGLIVIGNRSTLCGGEDEEESTGVWRRLLGCAASAAFP